MIYKTIRIIFLNLIFLIIIYLNKNIDQNYKYLYFLSIFYLIFIIILILNKNFKIF